jgi:hypothetical protein
MIVFGAVGASSTPKTILPFRADATGPSINVCETNQDAAPRSRGASRETFNTVFGLTIRAHPRGSGSVCREPVEMGDGSRSRSSLENATYVRRVDRNIMASVILIERKPHVYFSAFFLQLSDDGFVREVQYPLILHDHPGMMVW